MFSKCFDIEIGELERTLYGTPDALTVYVLSSNPTPTHYPLEKVDPFVICLQISTLMETQISFLSEPLYSDVQ